MPTPERPASTPLAVAPPTARSTHEFAGLDDKGRFGVAIALAREGAVVAFVTDGEGVARWLAGSLAGRRLTATGTGGSTLSATLAGGRVRGRASGTGWRATFDLAPADAASGLRRLAAADGRRTTEAGVVITPDGDILGAVLAGGRVVAAWRDSALALDEAAVTPAPPVGSPAPVPFSFARCSGLVLKHSWNQRRFEEGSLSESEWNQMDDRIHGRFEELKCDRWYDLFW